MTGRLDVVLPSPQRVVHTSYQQYCAEHHARPVHVFHRGRVYHGEEACDAGYGDVEDCEGVDRDRSLTKREARRGERFVA